MIPDRMPLNGESPSTQSRQEFCLALKAARERKGISLAQLAESTKIPASLFAALERNDLRRWPKGLFRRSFFRDYVRTIGVPEAEACEEFVRLFPDETSATVATMAVATADAEQNTDVRLVFDTTWHGPHAPIRSRLLVALLDAIAVGVLSAVVARVSGLSFPSAIASVGLAYFSFATALLSESPAHWLRARRRSLLDAVPTGTLRAWPRLQHLISSVFGQADTGAGEPVEEPEIHTWISDAHRVEPAIASRLRVRIKMLQ